MTTPQIAHLANAKQMANGWIAQCPAHDDRSPSLSIREGRDGRTLLRCFAGCELDTIVRALGLGLSDLFAETKPDYSYARTFSRKPTAPDVESALQAELARIIADESIQVGFEIATLTRHRNEARAVVERRLSVRLKQQPSPWYEVEPHCIDPAWSGCVDEAINVAAAHRGLTAESLHEALDDLPKTQDRVLRYARRLQRSLSKEPALRRSCAA
jgi:hypothetical protein